MKNPNICIISEKQQILGIGGTETVSYILKEELRKNNYNVLSAFFVSQAPMTENDLLFPNGLDNICSDKNIDFLISTIIEKQIDIIILQGIFNDKLLTLCNNTPTKTKLIYTYHFSPFVKVKDYDDYKDRLLQQTHNPIIALLKNLYVELKRKSYEKKSLKYTRELFLKYDIERIDAFISLTKEYTKYIQSIYPQQFKEKFHTIHNPILIDNTTEKYEKENIILFVGRLTYQKRLDRLLFVWKHLYNKFNDWKVIVVGDGEYADEYQKMTEKLQLGNIEFVGQQPSDIYFKKSKIFCMTSSHEGLPMVLIEAQKYGCVPIAYNSFEASTDIIQNYHNGVLVAPFNEKEYTKALRTLITNDEMRKRLAANGKEFIKKFDSKMIVKEWIKLFNSL